MKTHIKLAQAIIVFLFISGCSKDWRVILEYKMPPQEQTNVKKAVNGTVRVVSKEKAEAETHYSVWVKNGSLLHGALEDSPVKKEKPKLSFKVVKPKTKVEIEREKSKF